jgi:hypothetical protein
MAGQPCPNGTGYPLGPNERFQIIHSPFPGFAWRTKSLSQKFILLARTFATVGSEVVNIGYARVSTLDQNLDLQMQALRKFSYMASILCLREAIARAHAWNQLGPTVPGGRHDCFTLFVHGQILTMQGCKSQGIGKGSARSH